MWERGAERLRSIELPRFSKLDDDRSLICVLALVDLFASGDHRSSGCSEAACNWLGTFFYEVLEYVAALGPDAMNSRPKAVRQSLDNALDTLRSALIAREELASKLLSLTVEDIPPLDQLDAA